MNRSIRVKVTEIISKRVSTIRVARGLTMKDLAKKAHVHYTHVQKIEGGKKLPSLKTICALAQGLGVQPAELLMPAEARRGLGQKKEQLIKRLRESTDEELDIFFTIINAIHKSKS